jgi:hypothetical protein
LYVDTGLLGDIFTLRELTVHQVQSLEYLNEAEATYRFGPGNQSGVIWVHSGQW